MITFRSRRRRWWLGAIAAVLAVTLAAVSFSPLLEREVRARLESAAARHGAVVRLGVVHVGMWPLLRLEGLDLSLGHGAQLHVDKIAATWPGHWRLAIRGATIVGPGGVRVTSAATVCDIAGTVGEDLRLRLVEPQINVGIRLRYQRGRGVQTAKTLRRTLPPILTDEAARMTRENFTPG